MSSCHSKDCLSTVLRKDHIRVLKIVLAVNAAMFVAEGVGAYLFQSVALLGDAMDMLQDSLVYAVTLYVMDRSTRWKAGAALGKGLLMLFLGAWVMGQTIYHAFSGVVPAAQGMGLVGLAALAANTYSLVLLFRHKDDDLNMRSTWLCSRNDVVANVGIMAAAGLVRWTGTPWPDLLMGGGIAAMILVSSFHILRESLHDLRSGRSS